jgi:DNA-binding response OmpR family regulator
VFHFAPWLLRLLLQLSGFVVEEAPDGPEGVRKARALVPAVAVIVIGLPFLSGYEENPMPLATVAATRRILVVDGFVDGADSLAWMLQLEGHQVQTVYRGDEVLDAAQRFRPEAVLLDLGLPGALSSYDLAVHLRHMPGLEGILLIAVTAFGRPEDRNRAHACGISFFLVKPIDLAQLKALLSR